MKLRLTPCPLQGSVAAIPSKSQAHRLLICAALADRPSLVQCGGVSGDILATVRCLTALGAQIRQTEAGFSVSPIETVSSDALLEVGESGSTLRFLLPVAGALGGGTRFKMEGRLPRRPLSPLDDQLKAGGVTLDWTKDDTLAVGGKLTGGCYTLPGNISSQFISGLLFALPGLPGDSGIRVTGAAESADYLTMTVDALRAFSVRVQQTEGGYRIPGGQTYRAPETVQVEGDWSNSAFWLCAGALGKAPVTVTGLELASSQGDRRILELLRQFGARVACTPQGVTVSPGSLHGIVLDARDVPDLVPVAAVVAAAAQGETRIEHGERLRLKESDRLEAVAALLSGLGAQVRELPDGLVISGGSSLRGGRVSAFGDHRIAMAAAVASIVAEHPVELSGAQAVDKSYPGFWEDFAALGGCAEHLKTKEELA